MLTSKNIFATHWAGEIFRNDITCIGRGLPKPKEARMQNDFFSEEKLPTEGGVKKTRFRSFFKDGIVWHWSDMIKCSKLTQREWVCGHDNLAGAQFKNTSKNVNISSMYEAKIAYRYCKSQTIAPCKGISILIIQLKRTNCSSKD